MGTIHSRWKGSNASQRRPIGDESPKGKRRKGRVTRTTLSAENENILHESRSYSHSPHTDSPRSDKGSSYQRSLTRRRD